MYHAVSNVTPKFPAENRESFSFGKINGYWLYFFYCFAYILGKCVIVGEICSGNLFAMKWYTGKRWPSVEDSFLCVHSNFGNVLFTFKIQEILASSKEIVS